MTSSLQAVALVVAENNSAWPAWVERWQRQARNVLLIVQQPGEDIADLVRRLRARVRQMTQRGEELRVAALIGGPKFRSTGALAAVVSEHVQATHGAHVIPLDHHDTTLLDRV